jgi:hypothetical protein
MDWPSPLAVAIVHRSMTRRISSDGSIPLLRCDGVQPEPGARAEHPALPAHGTRPIGVFCSVQAVNLGGTRGI